MQEAFEKTVRSVDVFFIFFRLNSSVVGLVTGFLTSGLDFGNFW